MIRLFSLALLLGCLWVSAGDTPTPGQHILDAVAATDRPDNDKQRDAARKPAEVLAFFGIEPGMNVVELMAGSGYYIDIIARAVKPGKAYAQNNEFVLKRFAEKNLADRLKNSSLSNVSRLDKELDDPQLPKNLDAVLMILFYHDTYWQNVDREKMNKAVYDSLKPGGIFGIVDHHAETGSGSRDVQTIHRVDRTIVVDELLAAGFQLVDESKLLEYPDDDRTENVFKPTIRGKTDRFILKFQKK